MVCLSTVYHKIDGSHVAFIHAHVDGSHVVFTHVDGLHVDFIHVDARYYLEHAGRMLEGNT